MTQEEKLSKAVEFADAMYYAAQMMSTDASHLKEAMEKWWQFKNVELKESEDERIRERLIEFFKDWGKTRSHCWSISIPDILAWLEKQGDNTPTIIWHNIDEKPEEMKELFCEWESDDATWHDVAFYDEESHTFRHAKMPINVTKWVYVDELLEKQGEQKPFDYENADIQQKDFAPKETVKEAESNLTPLERKVKDILFSFHINAADGISFDGTMAIVHNLITLCQQEQKPAWSQEDREYMESLLDIINGTPSLTPSEVECHKDWLKSLKQRIAP